LIKVKLASTLSAKFQSNTGLSSSDLAIKFYFISSSENVIEDSSWIYGFSINFCSSYFASCSLYIFKKSLPLSSSSLSAANNLLFISSLV